MTPHDPYYLPTVYHYAEEFSRYYPHWAQAVSLTTTLIYSQS